MSVYPRPEWLNRAIFYEIYPQSFADSNGDGIGDIPGIISRLDYLTDLGVNAIWLNPLFDSPFKDAGYDVRDYKLVAPRYGTNADLEALFRAAHDRQMHVLLDLVPGHTSEEHPWFQASAAGDPAQRGETGERYIWTDSWEGGGAGYPFIGGEAERDGTYILNFFKCQPALNYGWADPQFSWQHPVLGDAPRATAEAMIDVMRFWLERGADGFRVDMASSLVKHEPEGKPGTRRTWRYIFDRVRPDFPQAAFVSEWGSPAEALPCGFDMDFYLDWHLSDRPNGYHALLRESPRFTSREGDKSFFNFDSPVPASVFFDDYLELLADTDKSGGLLSLITCNHDTPRIAPRLTERERALAFTTLLTLPGVPFIYYGDEIGMSYRELPTKEGGYTRTGSRTPMQWDASPNLGFSTAPAASLYLPVESGENPPTVESESARPDSLYHTMKRLLALRSSLPALNADASFTLNSAEGRLFMFSRAAGGVAVTVCVNPTREPAAFNLPEEKAKVWFEIGQARLEGHRLQLGPESLAIV